MESGGRWVDGEWWAVGTAVGERCTSRTEDVAVGKGEGGGRCYCC